MRKTELRSVVEAIERAGFTADEIKIVNDDLKTTVTFVPVSKIYFNFIMSPNDFETFATVYYNYAPKPLLNGSFHFYYNLAGALTNFRDWLKSLKKYIPEENLTDPLEEFIAKTSKAFPQIDDNDKTLFEESEKRLVKEATKKLEGLLSENFQLTEEGKDFVKEKLKKVIEPTERVNKGEWKQLPKKLCMI